MNMAWGVPVDYNKAADFYRRAAEGGRLLSLYALGALSAKDRLVPRNDVEGLALLLIAAQRAGDGNPASAFIREDGPAQARRLMERMSPRGHRRGPRARGRGAVTGSRPRRRGRGFAGGCAAAPAYRKINTGEAAGRETMRVWHIFC